MECKDCPYLVKRENISLLSQLMGYTSECSKKGILFCLEECNGTPCWCPLNEVDIDKWEFMD